jgi:hypothetical protein
VSDHDAIIGTVTDYWEGWFGGDVERMRRALHPALAKTGVSGARGVSTPMSAQDMIRWTGEGEGVAGRPADMAYDITVQDVYGDIATVTVHSAVYREYLHLVRTPAGWAILNALYMPVGAPAAS